jgi:hypothetical protein
VSHDEVTHVVRDEDDVVIVLCSKGDISIAKETIDVVN